MTLATGTSARTTAAFIGVLGPLIIGPDQLPRGEACNDDRIHRWMPSLKGVSRMSMLSPSPW